MGIKIFAHRGFSEKSIKQNSIESLKNAYNKGFVAIEFDIWFDKNELLIKHNSPKNDEILPRFSDFLRYKNHFYYWLDFKNLNQKNAILALKIADEEIRRKKIKLEKVFFAPFITDEKKSTQIYKKIREVFGDKVNVVAVCENLENPKNYYDFLKKNNIKFLSIYHKIIDEKFIKIFSDIELFAWTINDSKRISELTKLGVKNFASDVLL
jgi:glycerophosphoryl diester phosphodiesterase